MSLKSARKKYLDTEEISEEVFNELKKNDPSKTFKYIEAMCRFYLNKHVDHGYTQSFHQKHTIKFISRIIYHWERFRKKGYIKEDINQLTFVDCVDIVLEAGYEFNIKFMEKKDTRKYHETVIVDNDKFKIVVPHTDMGSIKYGKGTQWCTSAIRYNRFNEYQNAGHVFYYVHFKDLDTHPDNPELNSNYYKTAIDIDFEEDEIRFWDVNDNKILTCYSIDLEESTKEVRKDLQEFIERHYSLEFQKVYVPIIKHLTFSRRFLSKKYIQQNNLAALLPNHSGYIFNDDGTLDKFYGDCDLNSYIEAKGENCIKIKNFIGDGLYLNNLKINDLSNYIENVECSKIEASNLDLNKWSSFPKGSTYNIDLSNSKIKNLHHLKDISYFKINLNWSQIKSLKLISKNVLSLHANRVPLEKIDYKLPNKMNEIVLENNNLKSLKNLPNNVGAVYLRNNNIQDLKHLPQKFDEMFLDDNEIKEIPENLMSHQFNRLYLHRNKIKINDIFIEDLVLNNIRGSWK